MKEGVTLETFCDISYILVMELNDFPDKNLFLHTNHVLFLGLYK
jgi:hypothetical protein